MAHRSVLVLVAPVVVLVATQVNAQGTHPDTALPVVPVSYSFTTSVSAQVEVQPEQRYLLLTTTRTSTMQEELDEAAALGFRIVTGSPASSEIAILLERVLEPSDRYEYVLLATSRVSTMQEEMSAAAAQGFRLLPETIMITSGGTGFGFLAGSGEMVAVMERGPRVTARYEYFLIATSLTSTLQEEVTEATEAGFAMAALSGGRENIEYLALMERVVP